MPMRTIVQSVEASLRHCREQAAALDDVLLLYLIDMSLLHLRKKATSAADNSAFRSIQENCARAN